MTIETRLGHGDCGFVYVGKTRMGFSPIRAVRRDFPNADALILWTAARWPEPTLADVGNAIDQIAKRFPGRAIFADAEGGPVPVKDECGLTSL